MNWSEETDPNDRCQYTHTTCETPLGTFFITWKSWKSSSPIDVELNEEIIEGYLPSVRKAKEFVKEYLAKKRDELTEFLQEDEQRLVVEFSQGAKLKSPILSESQKQELQLVESIPITLYFPGLTVCISGEQFTIAIVTGELPLVGEGDRLIIKLDGGGTLETPCLSKDLADQFNSATRLNEQTTRHVININDSGYETERSRVYPDLKLVLDACVERSQSEVESTSKTAMCYVIEAIEKDLRK